MRHVFEVRQTAAFAQWLHSIPEPARKKVAIRIVRLQSGLLGDVKPVGGRVSELRIDHGPGYRVYFTRIGNVVVLLLTGGDKSSQKRDIATAREMRERLGKEVP